LSIAAGALAAGAPEPAVSLGIGKDPAPAYDVLFYAAL